MISRLRLALGRPPGDVVDRRLVEAHADDDGAVERRVGLAVAAAVEPVAMVLPLLAGIGQTPQSLAQAGSERTRSGLSPATISISAAVSGPIPNAATIAGATAR